MEVLVLSDQYYNVSAELAILFADVLNIGFTVSLDLLRVVQFLNVLLGCKEIAEVAS